MRRARKAELRDREASTRLLKTGDSIEQRLNARVGGIQLPRHLELDQLCVPILRDVADRTSAQIHHLRQHPKLHEHGLHGRAENWVCDRS
jgi:hypothetical protein